MPMPLSLWMPRKALLPALCLLSLCACGGGGEDIMNPEGGAPFGGREIRFQSYYAHFPTSFGVTLVRDTLPYDEACGLLKKFGKTPLPALKDHYSLIFLIQTAAAGDDITVDLNNRGPAGDMRSIGIGFYARGQDTPSGFGVDAGGVVRFTTLEQGKRVAGSYSIKFRTGETSMDSFDVMACP